MSVLHLETMEQFDEKVLNSNKLVLVDFWADWCIYCKLLAPTLEDLANQYEDKLDVVKVNADQFPKLTQDYQVMGLPTLLLFKGGALVDQTAGNQPIEALRQLVDSAL